MIKVIIPQCILIDECIAQEIVFLNSAGVRTEGCCCGHGEDTPHALIKPSSKSKALELGYAPECYETGYFRIELKSECHCEKAGDNNVSLNGTNVGI